MRFTGFFPRGMIFLENLRDNNQREWFLEHKTEYLDFIYEPMKALVTELTPTMEGIDAGFVTEPHRVVSRIYRDTRFSKNKLPYRTAVWMSFHRRTADWKDSPVFYLEISLTGYRYGMGFYQAIPATMMKFRAFVDRYPDDFLNAISFFSPKFYLVDGEFYKKPFVNPHPKSVQPYYQAKTFYLSHEAQHDALLFSRKLVSTLQKNFERLKPLYDFIWRMKNN